MAVIENWVIEAAEEIASHFSFGGGRDNYVTDEQRAAVASNYYEIILRHCPFKLLTAYQEVKEPPLLQCVDCKNTESPAGAMARQFNHGRCLRCGGYFKVVRA